MCVYLRHVGCWCVVSVSVQTVCMHNIRMYVQVYSTCSQGFRGCSFTVEGSSVLLKLLPYECSICIYNVAQSGMIAQCHIISVWNCS